MQEPQGASSNGSMPSVAPTGLSLPSRQRVRPSSSQRGCPSTGLSFLESTGGLSFNGSIPSVAPTGRPARRLTARFDRATRSALGPALHEDLGAAASATLERRAGTSESNARAASQLRQDLAPPARRPRAPARQQRGVAGPAQRVHALKRASPGSVVVVGDSCKTNPRQASQYLGKY